MMPRLHGQIKGGLEVCQRRGKGKAEASKGSLTNEEEHGSGSSFGGALAGHGEDLGHDDPEDAGIAHGEAQQEDAHGEEGQGGCLVRVSCGKQHHASGAHEAACYEQWPAASPVHQGH